MSKQAVHQYYNTIDKIKRFSGSRKESTLRRAFATLLDSYCLPKNLMALDEVELKKSNKRPDGTVKNAMQLDYGYWENKDEKDNLDEEIDKKFELGYPKTNIIFENTVDIILIQQGQEILRGKMRDEDFLDRILTAFVNYERPEIKEFHKAIEKFKEDIPDIIEALRSIIADQSESNKNFEKARDEFWELCKESINPEISAFDIREMLIQHILTAEIFNVVFGDSHFHRENNIAKELENVINTFFVGKVRHDTLTSIDSYYRAIKAEAALIDDYHEKQKFLKVVYENFYKAYNPKGADRLGVVYTPNEIVRFMIESTDYLLDKHFGKSLANKNVEILDPATGTGTFICDLIEHIPPQYLEYKYKNEIHANELAILPYYIANLNIEHTYLQKMESYQPFENIVFVDTLDNLGFGFEHKQDDLFGFSAENLVRIKRQNEKKISVVFGNPPYNANQMNENDNNKNREYPNLDKRIKQTFIKESTAQKTKVYDMYARFYRWAMDRVDKNGIIAFITNRSFIDSKTFDGFRKIISKEFNYAYIVDTQSDVRKNPKIAGTTHNVFGIQTGVAIMFLIKKDNEAGDCRINYYTLYDEMTKREKLEWFTEHPLKILDFEKITPDKNNNWLNISDNDFDGLIPLINRETKLSFRKEMTNVLFKFFNNGVAGGRDYWLIDFNDEQVAKRVQHFIKVYSQNKIDVHKKINSKKFVLNNNLDYSIKWTNDLKKYLINNLEIVFNKSKIIKWNYRPYTKTFFYADYNLNDRLTNNHYVIFGNKLDKKNLTLCFSGQSSSKGLQVIMVDTLFSYDYLEKTQCIPLYIYDEVKKLENITDWGLTQFTEHYKNKKITKEEIFHYVYGVLHNPAYRKKYEINLKREFPRIPFYKDFYKWVKWGKELMELHINFETVAPYKLKQVEEKPAKKNPKAKLKAVIENNEIILDENTSLTNIPPLAWEYKLGNRSALHWILDQYKEKKPKDPTIAVKFNTYKFSDYKEQVIDLLKRVTTVSVKTMEIVNQMETEEGHKN